MSVPNFGRRDGLVHVAEALSVRGRLCRFADGAVIRQRAQRCAVELISAAVCPTLKLQLRPTKQDDSVLSILGGAWEVLAIVELIRETSSTSW